MECTPLDSWEIKVGKKVKTMRERENVEEWEDERAKLKNVEMNEGDKVE